MVGNSGKSVDGQSEINLNEVAFWIPNYFLKPADFHTGFDDFDPTPLHSVTSGRRAKVAVVDSGIDFDHPALRPNIKDCADFTNSSKGCKDEDGHGTLVAGVIAAVKVGDGMVGIAPDAGLYIAKVIRGREECDIGRLRAGIEWAIEREVDLINISLGAEKEFEEIEEVVKLAFSRKIYVICGAGNRGKAGLDFPAKLEQCIAVGAIDSTEDRWEDDGGIESSAVGKGLDVVALGKHVQSTTCGGGYGRGSGTSMAAPFVTGVLALVKAKQCNGPVSNPINSLKELLERLRLTSKDLGTPCHDDEFGFGRIDPKKLLDSI
jgi:subtilisin family serine protease